MVLTTKVLFYQKVRPGDDASYDQAADVELWGGLFLTYYCAPVGVITEKTDEDSRSNRRPIELIGSPACQRSQISDRWAAE